MIPLLERKWRGTGLNLEPSAHKALLFHVLCLFLSTQLFCMKHFGNKNNLLFLLLFVSMYFSHRNNYLVNMIQGGIF